MLLQLPTTEEQQMRRADTYQQWKRAAQRYDRRFKLDRWKRDDRSQDYDFVEIRARLEQLRELRARKDNQALLFTLNEGIHGNLGGMGRPSLYRKAKFGTKKLIIDYTEEVVAALEHLASGRVRNIDLDDKLDFFQRASHCYGRSALLMSGAGSLLYYHLGVIKALWEQGVLPSILSGSSGGAFIAGLVGTRSDSELGELFDDDFLEAEAAEEGSFVRQLFPFSRVRMSADEIWEVIERLVPDMTFQEAYEHSKLHINISVAPVEHHQASRLLNAITSPNVMVREAVLASCAVPAVYPPVTLAARNSKGRRQPYLANRKWVDGSVAQDLPLKRLSRLYGVNHSVVSQTNPLVLPFISEFKNRHTVWDILRDTGLQTAKDWSLAAAQLIQKPLGRELTISRWINTYGSVISQTYTGDINILPASRSFNPFHLLSSRTKREILDLIRMGERATWPTIEKIRTQTRISRALDGILERFEDRLVTIAQKQQIMLDRSA
ncbi:MAG: DUF3336 domain-containing protein [Pseudomonadota bacterium]